MKEAIVEAGFIVLIGGDTEVGSSGGAEARSE